jgi:glycosyltransferase involved in cell wall biosynthesis
MRIGIDARFFGSTGKGLGRYTQRLVENLEKTDYENQYFIFLRKENFEEYQPKNPNFHRVMADFRWYTFSEQINMPRILNKYNLDLVHFPHFNVPILYRKKFIITIHDLILIHFPTVKNTTLNPFFYWFKFAAYKLAIWLAIRRAAKVVAVSNFTKNDILQHYKIPEDKICVTYEASDTQTAEIRNNSEAIFKKYGIMKPYIMYVGNAYPHKNLEALILAFGEIKKVKANLKLVLVGKEDYFYARLKKFAQAKKIDGVIFAGFVPDSDLHTIYRNAELYVFASLYEGFGIPPLEAMARGIPVASSDHECMKEVLGENVYYFDAKKPENIARAVIVLMDDKVLQENLVQKGYEQIKKYSWQKMAEETLEIYNCCM